MVSESEPTGILAGRPIGASSSASTCYNSNNNINNNNNNNNNNINNNSINNSPGNSQPAQHHTKDNNANKNIETYDVDERHMSNLLVRPSWTDAAIALDQVEKGKATGQRSKLWIRARFQDHLSRIADFLQRNAGKVLFVTILILATLSIAVRCAHSRNKVEQLWIQEGGTLERELNYAEDWLGESAPQTHQLIIQMPKHSGANVLNPQALKEHLNIISQAMQVTVEMFEVTWSLRDICVRMTIPDFDNYHIEQIFEKMIPCNIMSPLDCFWEGSKLMGPEYPVVEYMKNTNETMIAGFPFYILEEYMKRAGITNAYQTKPCLDPTDPHCPETAPNKKSRQPLDVAGELTGGCHGFATKFMHWPEALLIGGAKRNRTGHLMHAAALQTVIQLMSERELYDSLTEDYKTHNIGWTQEKASQVLESWQRAFFNTVKKLQQHTHYPKNSSLSLYNSYAFSTITMNDIISKHSEMSLKNVGIACGLVILYSCIVLFHWQNPMFSQSGIGLGGVILVCATITAGLGFCAVLGLPFNVITTQILPYLLVGLGCHDTFLITHADASDSCSAVTVGSSEETRPLSSPAYSPVLMSESHRTTVILKRVGLSILLKGLCTASGLGIAAIIPIPALRVFSLKAAVLSIFILISMLIAFPALLSLDLRRRKTGRWDILCCCFLSSKTAARINKKTHIIYENKSNNIRNHVTANNKKHYADCKRVDQNEWTDSNDDNNINRNHKENYEKHGDNYDEVDMKEQKNLQHQHYCHHHQYEDTITCCGDRSKDCLPLKFSLRKFAYMHYGPFLTNPLTKVIGMIMFAIILIGSVLKGMNIEEGLELGDLVPQHSKEHAFLEAQSKYYGFYSMFAVTERNFDYPNNQQMLYDYHDAFTRVKNVIKKDESSLPQFWLSLFRDWLKGLQAAFDRDYKNGCITQERWFKNASDEGILAYKLLVQTGHVDNPIEKQLISSVRLVDSDGIINPRAFYNYLSAWVWNDALAYGASQANLRPVPRQWIFVNDEELKIPKSSAIAYAQIPFYLHRLNSTAEITELIRNARNLCTKFAELGLPNFPYGIPFIFWEQYMNLKRWLLIAFFSAIGANMLIVGVLLLNAWAAMLVGLSLGGIVVQLFGLMSLFGMKLNAISAVLLVISVGISVHFTADICLSFVTCVGNNRDRRIRLALEHMFAPVIHGAIVTFLPIIMLAFSDFEFIVRYFFPVLSSLIGIGLLNGLFFFPILLSLVGPNSEITPPPAHPDRIATPTPPASPEITRRKRHHRSSHHSEGPPRRPHKIDNNNSRQLHQMHSEPSLTTITEEPNSWHSTQESCIIVQPEVKVETTSTCGNQNCNGNGGASDNNGTSSVLTSTPHIITTTKSCCNNSSNSSSSSSSNSSSNSTNTNVSEKVFTGNNCNN
ncbi:Similar to Ptch1: Protein patched homolog 1 (Mus musculus) [Cotesia congregata]|uniref:Similar to Ptch1: Protein patched homolog 1 (Mus musculus) n=1 Tax=Cotesia congregata TaxID=51543 RepID=A0A8J2MXZ3_COTCN|nr:Similar to Ptch1: Protein patched homolog 1 (Mus musculus) [Cotesia congregata]